MERNFATRFTSRKFLAMLGAFAILLLGGSDLFTFGTEVMGLAAATLFGYPIVEGYLDSKSLELA